MKSNRGLKCITADSESGFDIRTLTHYTHYMKTCTKCSETKPLDQFSKSGDRIHSHCKTCRNAQYRAYGKSDKEKERLRLRTIENRAVAREFVQAEKSKPCTDCKNTFPYYVMQFDHLGDKVYDVAWMASHGYTVKRLTVEIAKCELVCANCHAERTHRRRVDTLGLGVLE